MEEHTNCSMENVQERSKGNSVLEKNLYKVEGLYQLIGTIHEKCVTEFVPIMHNLTLPEGKMALITHGDFHMWNIGFHTTEAGKLKFFDFQVTRYGNPVIDIQIYLSQV